MRADKVEKAGFLRVRVFIDFWNFSLSLRSRDKEFRADWHQIGKVFAHKAGEIVDANLPVSYEAAHVYGSYDPDSEKDRRLGNWFKNTLNRIPGVHAVLKDRQKVKSPPRCPACRESISHCPKCNADMRGTQEKGIDTTIVTDMIMLALAEAYDVAVLVSSDRDFVPVAEFLQTRGVKVIHGSFPPVGIELSQKCWGNFEIPKLMPKFKQK